MFINIKRRAIITVIIFALILVVNLSCSSEEPKILPIISVGSNEIIGGVINGKWADAKSVSAHIKEMEYSIYQFDQLIGSGRAKITKDNLIEQKLSEGINPNGFSLGLTADSQPVPRRSYQQKTDLDIYKSLVRGYIKKAGLKELQPQSIEVLRVDLEGDGSEEVIVTDFEENDNEAFAIVILRKVIAGSVKNIILVEGSDSYTTQQHAENEPLIVDSYKVNAILDLNNDGKMEIILEGYGFEAISLKVFEVMGDRALTVIDYPTRRFWNKGN